MGIRGEYSLQMKVCNVVYSFSSWRGRRFTNSICPRNQVEEIIKANVWKLTFIRNKTQYIIFLEEDE